MSYYNVVAPCVVGKLHYATVPDQPIEVDDEVAAPLVESGCLTSYPAQSPTADALEILVNANLLTPDQVEDVVAPKPRRPRKPRA